MELVDKTTNHWYQIFRRYPPEPAGLRKWYCLCFGGTIVVFLLAGIFSYKEHGWTQAHIKSESCNCSAQKTYHAELTRRFEKDKVAAENRLEALEKSRFTSTDPNFKQSWSWFEEEINQLRIVIHKKNPYSIRSLKDSYLEILTYYVISLLFYILISRLVLLHAKSLPYDIFKKDITDWKSSYLFFGLLIGSLMVIANVFTSVVADKKLWFGWDSFCVSPWAFSFEAISFLFYGFVAATPFTVFWCVSRKQFIPTPDATASDSRFGVSRYVEFLQIWTMWLVLAPSTIGIIWLRFAYKNEPQLSPARFLIGIGPAIIISMIVFKLVRNAIILRFQCRAIIEKSDAAAANPPQDPTLAFLGAEWWKLPATLTVSLTVIWAILNFLGMTETIKALLD